MATDYTYLYEEYPEVISADQLYRICHISKRKAKWLLEHGYIPCEDSGKKTRRYKIRLNDVIDCYEMTFFNRKSQRTFTCQIVQNTKRHLKRAKTMQISGIGHSVIRGLVTTGQWFSASTTVYPRGLPQGRRHSYFVDC